MPPRIRTRASKALKENIGTENKVKSTKNSAKPPRKALADKTNSASDDTSVEVPSKNKKAVTKSSNVETKLKALNNDVRPRRDRRLPGRFVENPILTSLSNSKESVHSTPPNKSNNSKLTNTPITKDTHVKNTAPEASPFKTPSKSETSLVVSRPRRICRLPSRFDDHSISPNKYIPIQPANASTPIQKSKAKVQATSKEKVSKDNQKVDGKLTSIVKPTRSAKAAALQKKASGNSSTDKSSPDTNNNAKGESNKLSKAQPIVLLTKVAIPKPANGKKFFNKTSSPQSSPTKKISPKPTKKIPDKNLSFKLLGSKKRSQNNETNDLDIYEFTFDPNEEPQPQKKKRKKPAVKKLKAPKPKPVVAYKSAYDQNISKALSALKKAVKPTKSVEPAKLPQIEEISDEVPEPTGNHAVPTSNMSAANPIITFNDTGKVSVHECNYPSIRVEDIAADIEPSIDHHDDLNYSPVNSPRPGPVLNNMEPRTSPERIANNDPLNLQQDLSFFDDVPVASSSMNMSVRHPLASPWRVEFGNLPIKWPVNAYVKPNMTPAVESSFICSEDSTKKKHVYTNMVAEPNESLPQIVNTPTLKQTSIISFIKEVAERKAKKKRGRSVSPTKAQAMFDNVDVNIVPENQNNKEVANNVSEEVSSNTNNDSNEKENSKEERRTRKRKNDGVISDRPVKSPRKQKDKDCTYFGFDDSENQDQENVSPVKEKVQGRSLRPRSRVVLQEINGPTRAALPLAAKSKVATSSEAVNKVYEELKSAADAPVFPEKNVENIATNIVEPSFNDDSQSVHLFEDIEVVHHLKPTRKSYGKAKKVTFRQRSTSDSDTQEGIVQHNDTSFEDDLADLTFEVLKAQEKKKSKKKKPKKLMTKKEEKEAEEWAAGFNSMCEEIEDFPLVVE